LDATETTNKLNFYSFFVFLKEENNGIQWGCA